MLPQSADHFLPQKFPFQMIDTLLQSDETIIKTSFTIKDDNVLVSNGTFTEGGLIENIAQSAAAGTGYYYLSQDKKVPIGYIGAVKNILIRQVPVIGSYLETELKTLYQIGNANIVEGKIFLDKQLIASCELTIFVAD